MNLPESLPEIILRYTDCTFSLIILVPECIFYANIFVREMKWIKLLFIINYQVFLITSVTDLIVPKIVDRIYG